MVKTTRVFWAPGVPRVVGAPFAGMGTLFFVWSVCQLLGVPVVKLEGNVWIGVLIGGIFAAVGWGILLRGTRLIVDVEGRTYVMHWGLVIGGKTRRGTWEDFGLVEVQRESRSGGKGRTYWVWSVRLRWKDASWAAHELAGFTEGWREKAAREKARRFADDVAGLLGVMVLDQTGSEAVVREAGEVVERLAVKGSGAGEEAGALPAGARVEILQDDGEALRVMWRPKWGVAEVMTMVVPVVMLGFFGGGLVKCARELGGHVFGPGPGMPWFFMLFFSVIVAGMSAAVLGGIGWVGGMALFTVAGSGEVVVDGETVGYCVRVFGRRVRERRVAVGEVEEVFLREVSRGRVVVVETKGRDWKIMGGIGEAEGRWVVRKVRGRVGEVRGGGT